ncbi:hypothetical protein K501DRAFT_272690 [Backusella circina FSU 941]|nr:hypothetical protein K501DRAFT_272690 [Backusella circina FSU 941]
MNFAGYEELRAYVRDANHPSFKEFVGVNSLNIARCKKYDENKWQLIAKMAKTLFEASFVTRIGMLEAMIAAAPSSSSILKELLSSQKDEHKQQQKQEEQDVQQQEEKEVKRKVQQQQSSEEHQVEDLDMEGRIYLLGHKKFSGMELSDDEKNYLQSITNEGTIKSCIQFLAAQRLLLEELDATDAIIANIIKVDESGKHKLYSMEDMDELLEQIQTKKAECSKNKQRDTQLYQALSCMEVIGETGSKSTKLERETNKAIFHAMDISPTYSRKIDLLLKCKDAKTAIEMSSNEWKRASVAKNIQLVQHCKNLRVNTAILKNLKKLGVNRTLSMDWTGNSGYIYKLEWCPDQEVYFASNCIVVQLPSSPLLLFDIKPTLESLFRLKLSLLYDAKIIKTSLQIQKQKKNMQGIADSCSPSITTPVSTSLLHFPSSPTLSASNSPVSSLYSLSSNEVHLHEPFVFFTPRNSRIKRIRLLTEDEDDDSDDPDSDINAAI